MCDENDGLMIVEESETGKAVTTEKENVINGTEWVNDDTAAGNDHGIEVTAIWRPRDEEAEDDDIVILDECGEGDEFLEPPADKAPTETAESEKQPEKKIQVFPGRKKKERVFRRKVIRIPRDVFDYMARIEEDGTIRLNVTQFSVFFNNEISKKFVQVQAETWDTTDLVPLMDVSVPPTAKENPNLIVDNFSNEPVEREAQEKRLKEILEGRKRFDEKQKQQETGSASAAKILPAEGSAEMKNKAKPPMKPAEQNGKKSIEEEKLPNKKRTAEPSAPSSTSESGIAAKQPRLDEKNSAQSKAKKTFPKKTAPAPQKDGSRNGPKASSKGSSSKPPYRGGPSRNPMSRRLSPSYSRSGPSPFVSPLIGRREWQSGPAPFQNQRYPQSNVCEEQMRFGEPYPFTSRRGGSDVSPWSRPLTQPDEMYKLESVMRRAAQENASSFEAVRQVEKMGLGSVVGAILNAVDHRNPSYSTRDAPSQRIPAFVDEHYGRDPRMSSGLDYTPLPVRDISRYVEPLEEFNDSSRTLTSQPRPEPITYPIMGRAAAGSVGGSAGAPPFGQSYSAFASQSFGGRMDYGRDRSRSPVRRSYR